VIVLGPHRRNGLLGHLHGSVAAAVVSHTDIPVLLVPQPLDEWSQERPPARQEAGVTSAL